MGSEGLISVGECLSDELAERGWTVDQFAEIAGLPTKAVQAILDGRTWITTEMAHAFGEALGTTPELWLNLQAAAPPSWLRSKASEWHE